MAKITDIKFSIAGTDYKINVNCASNGEFTASLPDNVALALNLDKRVRSSKLHDLEIAIKSAVERYQFAQTSQEVMIMIRYKAAGNYMFYETGNSMFGAGTKYHLSTSSWDHISLLGFEFEVVIKETVDGVVQWYDTRKGSDYSSYHPQSESPDTYFKNDKINKSEQEKWKKIPFSIEAIETLSKISERIRATSETLYKFIEQDESNINFMLTNPEASLKLNQG